MAKTTARYRATESKYKGRAHELYVTYDIWQETRGGSRALYPKVKHVYVAGEVRHWRVGHAKKRSGRRVYGVRIEYTQTRRAYERKPYPARRGQTRYRVGPAAVGRATQTFTQVVEVPEGARRVRLVRRAASLRARYREALQRIR